MQKSDSRESSWYSPSRTLLRDPSDVVSSYLPNGRAMFRLLTFAYILAVTTLCNSLAFTQEIVFEDRFEGSLKPGWVWLHGNSASRRFVNNALEILTEPFGDLEARNALTRPLNFLGLQNGRVASSYRIETECCFTQKPQAQYQQCGIYWLQNDRVIFKFVVENLDGKTYIFPGKAPIDSHGGRLRITVTGQNIVAEFSGLNETSFRRIYEGRIECGPNDKISLQCWNGPQDGRVQDQWARFHYFRIEKLD